MTFKFDWHARDEDFVKWLFVHLIANKTGTDQFDQLSAATDKFTNVKLTMQVNGIELDAQRFIESVEDAYRQHAENTAKRMVDEAIPDLYQLTDAVETAQQALTENFVIV